MMRHRVVLPKESLLAISTLNRFFTTILTAAPAFFIGIPRETNLLKVATGGGGGDGAVAAR